MKDREGKTRDGEEKTKAWNGQGRVAMVTLWRLTSQATDATVFRRCSHQGLWRKRKEGSRQKRRE